MNFIKSKFILFSIVLIVVISMYLTLFSKSNSSPTRSPSTITVKSGKISLKGTLDIGVIEGMVKDYYIAGAKKKLKGMKLNEYVMHELQRGITAISLIDLDHDGNADLIFIVPYGDLEHFTHSIRVPDPSKVTTLPSGGSKASIKRIQDIAQNQSIEIVSVKINPKHPFLALIHQQWLLTLSYFRI